MITKEFFFDNNVGVEVVFSYIIYISVFLKSIVKTGFSSKSGNEGISSENALDVIDHPPTQHTLVASLVA